MELPTQWQSNGVINTIYMMSDFIMSSDRSIDILTSQHNKRSRSRGIAGFDMTNDAIFVGNLSPRYFWQEKFIYLNATQYICPLNRLHLGLIPYQHMTKNTYLSVDGRNFFFLHKY